ncbi:anti-sigma factor [Paeniroseomonas aquatica]|uniref:Anti-sigma factor n=1 Tax=Paeniroseomonas aquatica TaxID=373043 RepID=A0ABT8A8T5_9PROT|nr:anti-sigma factor [Paeniroseomonas aquatica]MDN3566187.1 anti-sigma factor [Paeniroseomonas aquatica]
MIPTDPQERDMLAGEYVLGTLDARAAAEVAAALPQDAALRAAVALWEARLAPLARLALPEAPPPDLWSRIEAALPGAGQGLPRRAAPFERRGSGSARRVSLWRGWALGASALAAGLAGFIVLRPAEPPRLMTVLLTQRDQPAWVVEADRSGALRLASINPQPVEANRVMQLWALPQGATAPTSLGLVPEGGRMTVTPSAIRAAPGMLIEITLEPPGGSPIGRPTGPVLFIGRLSAAGSS